MRTIGGGAATYLRLLDDDARDLLGKPTPGSTHYGDPVTTTWRITVKELSAEARAILRLTACYGGAPIPLDLLIGGASQIVLLGGTLPALKPRRSWLPWGGKRDRVPDRPPPAPDRLKAEKAAREAVGGQLHRTSMIQDWDGTGFRVHALVREVEWLNMDKAEHRYAGQLAARLLEAHAPADTTTPEQRQAADAVLAHGAALRTRLASEDLRWPDYKLPGILYELAAARGAVEAAETHAVDLYQETTRHFRPNLDLRPAAAARVAASLHANGRYAEAAELYRVVLNGNETQLGPEHPDTLSSRNNLAACLQAMGDLAAAEPLYRRTLADRERVQGPDHPHTLGSRNNLAGCLDAMGDLAAAEPLYRRTLADSERVKGPDHPHTLGSRNNLAGCLDAMGDLAAAEPLYRRTLADSERLLGPEHPDTLLSRNNLASFLYAMGDLAAAEPLFRAALAGAERVLGANHPRTNTFKDNLSTLLAGMAHAPQPVPSAERLSEPAQWTLTGIKPATTYTLGGTSFTLDLGKRD